MKKINVLLITPDQMRADHLSCYGYKRKTSPNIDALAEKGVLFSRNYAVGSWTTPTFPSMLTSLTPSQHGATLFGSTFYDPETPLLPEQFEKAGYKTAAFCNNGNATHPILSGPARGAIRGIQYLDMGEKNYPSISQSISNIARITRQLRFFRGLKTIAQSRFISGHFL